MSNAGKQSMRCAVIHTSTTLIDDITPLVLINDKFDKSWTLIRDYNCTIVEWHPGFKENEASTTSSLSDQRRKLTWTECGCMKVTWLPTSMVREYSGSYHQEFEL